MVIIKNWVARFRVFLLVSTVVISGCTPKGPQALLDGKKLIEQGRYSEAVKKLELAASLIGTNATTWNYLGLAYQYNRESTNAEQAYLKALLLDRNLAEAHYNLGCLRLEENRLDPARTELIVYTSLRGNVVEGWLKLAAAQMQLRELPAAEHSLTQALRLDRQNAEALNGLGVIQLQRRDPREAARMFASALTASPGYSPALLNLAIVNHSYLNNRPLALQKYREYLALTPRAENWDAVNATSKMLDQELNPQPKTAATAPASAPVTIPPGPAAQVRTQSAPLAKQPGNIAARTPPPKTEPGPVATKSSAPLATSTPREVVKLAPEATVKPPSETDVAARGAANLPRTAPAPVASGASGKTSKPGFLHTLNPLNLFRSSATNSRTVSATPLPKSVNAESPGGNSAAEAAPSFPRYKYRSPARPATGDSAGAERAFIQGSRAHQAGRLAEAIKAYTEATRLDPAYFEASYNLAVAATAAGNLSQALTAYETALAVRPESSDARYNFAVVLAQANYVVDSARELESMLARNPSDARAHVALGNLYAQSLREPAKAKEHYVKALELDPRLPNAAAVRFWLSSH